MAPAEWPCDVVSSIGTLMVMHGELSPCKDLAISAKLGGGICFCVVTGKEPQRQALQLLLWLHSHVASPGVMGHHW